MRAFLGVPLPALDSLKSLLRALAECGADLKLVSADQFHLTIKFLGDVRPEWADALVKLIGKEPLPPAFDIAVKDVGVFPQWRKFNVLWAGIEDPTGGLSKLNAAAERAWVGLGEVGEDRPFSPHLTLARKRGDKASDAARAVLTEHRGLAFGTAHVDRLNLYQSTLTPAGSIYEVVHEVRL